jgi:hypothetical protein
VHQLAEGIQGGGVSNRGQRRQCVPAEGRLVSGRLAQRRGRLRLVEIGQRLGRIETDLRIARGQAGLECANRFGADRFEL